MSEATWLLHNQEPSFHDPSEFVGPISCGDPVMAGESDLFLCDASLFCHHQAESQASALAHRA